jgi:hypothetical protein
MMNNSKKLALSKETLRSLDDDDLTDVVGGSRREHGGGGHNNNNSFGCSGICVSYECNSGICSGVLCIA